MTPDDKLVRWRQMVEKATPGPFRVKGQSHGHWYRLILKDGGDIAEFAFEDDAMLFAVAHEAVPALLDENADLRRRLAVYECMEHETPQFGECANCDRLNPEWENTQL